MASSEQQSTMEPQPDTRLLPSPATQPESPTTQDSPTTQETATTPESATASESAAMRESPSTPETPESPTTTTTPESSTTPQKWHTFNATLGEWVSMDSLTPAQVTLTGSDRNPTLQLLTWNINAAAPSAEARTTRLLTMVLTMYPYLDVMFLQEVSRPALQAICGHDRIRRGWFLSCSDDDQGWDGHLFRNLTLLSGLRFAIRVTMQLPPVASLEDKVWLLKYPSVFGRQAVCCDIFVQTTLATDPATEDMQETTTKRIRLVNVHLDSKRRYAYRRQQLTSVAETLREAGCGLVAGDFNAIGLEDDTLIDDCGLKDVWTETKRGLQDGFTWGPDERLGYPAARLDKAATFGLRAKSIHVVPPGRIEEEERAVPWSDHCGLFYVFEIA